MQLVGQPEPMTLYGAMELISHSFKVLRRFCDQDEMICPCRVREPVAFFSGMEALDAGHTVGVPANGTHRGVNPEASLLPRPHAPTTTASLSFPGTHSGTTTPNSGNHIV